MSQSEIIKFLQKVKNAKNIYICPTDKNKRTDYQLGWLRKEKEEFIKSLKTLDYISGLENDENNLNEESEIFVFKKMHNKHDIYIKISII